MLRESCSRLFEVLCELPKDCCVVLSWNLNEDFHWNLVEVPQESAEDFFNNLLEVLCTRFLQEPPRIFSKNLQEVSAEICQRSVQKSAEGSSTNFPEVLRGFARNLRGFSDNLREVLWKSSRKVSSVIWRQIFQDLQKVSPKIYWRFFRNLPEVPASIYARGSSRSLREVPSSICKKSLQKFIEKSTGNLREVASGIYGRFLPEIWGEFLQEYVGGSSMSLMEESFWNLFQSNIHKSWTCLQALPRFASNEFILNAPMRTQNRPLFSEFTVRLGCVHNTNTYNVALCARFLPRVKGLCRHFDTGNAAKSYL